MQDIESSQEEDIEQTANGAKDQSLLQRASSAVANIPVENRLAGIGGGVAAVQGDNRLIGSRSGARPDDQLFSNNNLIRLGSEPMPNFGGSGQDQILVLPQSA